MDSVLLYPERDVGFGTQDRLASKPMVSETDLYFLPIYLDRTRNLRFWSIEET